MYKYIVRFTYNGQYYQPTTYASSSTWGKEGWQTNSNATDIRSQRLEFNAKFDSKLISQVLLKIKNELNLNQDEQSWFAQLKTIGESLNFAPSGKILKQNPEAYVGSVSDVAEMLRVTLTGKRNSPNLYYVMSVLGKEACDKRIDLVISKLS